MHRLGAALAFAFGLAALAAPRPARALDKQGSAHGGNVGGEADDGFHASGSLMFGSALYNPTYAARPDNTGRALFRYAAHVDLDLIGRKLSIPLDLNVFTDRERRGALIFAPTELDVIGGLTSTWNAGPGAIEFGSRVEHDRPVDRSGFTQTYVDARTRYLYSLAQIAPGIGPALEGGDVSGWLTLGWFALNPTYAARPDNTGLALLRYALHVEVSAFDDLISLGLDGTTFTDRRASNVLRPTELDLTPEIIVRSAPFEVHLAYERDMPLDRGGLVQSFAYVLGVWSFDLKRPQPRPLEERTQIVSP
ncbi:MAG TPA: hypothetical protein VFS00_16280 [Polyangiaceae bacterium]|nr:hypothetical protein [Polyangiaceae bacterium]